MVSWGAPDFGLVGLSIRISVLVPTRRVILGGSLHFLGHICKTIPTEAVQ